VFKASPIGHEDSMKLFCGLLLALAIAVSCDCMLAEADQHQPKPVQSLRDCPDDCPEMVVIPAGTFMMGSSPRELGHQESEAPQHKVTIAKPFAVSKYELTFDEWDACADHGACDEQIGDGGWGRGKQPVINVTWDEAQKYATWLSKLTGKHYRLLSEAEYEYATRAGMRTPYPWGDAIGTNRANCIDCGSRWDKRQPAPVGSFAPNAFGLYDMVGNVWEWVEDCWHGTYKLAPTDGSAWTTGDCGVRVLRGGSWTSFHDQLRSANRSRSAADDRGRIIGFRVARTLEP
jgi:formylglycine-generating enzyme required for sulfatase activity